MDDKRRRIVDAATTLFSRYGFKRTSMDVLAAEAGLAKATVYAYFPDKESIFRAVVEDVCEGMLRGADEAARSGAPLEEQVAAMLSAKFTRYWELVHSSPHAQELMDSHGRMGAEIIERADKEFAKRLVSTLEGARGLDPKRAGFTLPQLAQLLLRAASGAAYDATSPAMHKKSVADLTRLILAGVRRG
jgi:AcrR family transcriptional regulator